MKHVLLALIILLIPQFYMAQTGPAGVGNPSSNPFWIKADKATSSTANNTPISSWNDQSGNGINVTQTISVQQPSFATNVLNGMPGIQFDNINASGQNDYMIAPDNSKLDNTAGYSFFTVSKMNNLDGSARSIVSKRTAADVDEAFMLFYYTSNYFFLDIDGTIDRQSTSPASLAVGNGYIMDAVYDGTLPTASRSKIYEGETLRKTFSESTSLVPDKVSPLNIGCTHATDTRPFGGYISEVIIYTITVNDAQRVIVNNYLSAKYNISLSSNDKYAGDDPTNGNYDFDVAGVGKESTGSNPSFSASVSGGLTLSTNSGLGDGDYILAGHGSPTNSQVTTDIGGMTGVNNARWKRIWYLNVTNSGVDINADIEFDMSDGGISPVTLGPSINYTLLYRSGLTGNWTEVVTASSVSGDRIIFSSYTVSNTGYYTIGTRNYLLSPLPVELLSFDAVMTSRKVDLSWTTATERNSAFFTVEKSKDAVMFEPLLVKNAAGNSSSLITYAAEDTNPFDGISYYRLRQTDLNGEFTLSKPVAVHYLHERPSQMVVYPNPSGNNLSLLFKEGIGGNKILVTIMDPTGKLCFSSTLQCSDMDSCRQFDIRHTLSAGAYIITAHVNEKMYREKLIIQD